MLPRQCNSSVSEFVTYRGVWTTLLSCDYAFLDDCIWTLHSRCVRGVLVVDRLFFPVGLALGRRRLAGTRYSVEFSFLR